MEGRDTSLTYIVSSSNGLIKILYSIIRISPSKLSSLRNRQILDPLISLKPNKKLIINVLLS